MNSLPNNNLLNKIPYVIWVPMFLLIDLGWLSKELDTE